ncbi:DUF2272 domain-containing protein [Teichococcus cervicalis]|uniref:DUF2272 domain-containing protein n=1 Tax=Pseudoroseomonas cervicalis ATCC 49957 TaxID=525371 RepID=D5RJ73_9PROT|nr:DUF2272 domain-containing protein [Pseudoroseomonas cervicalis]EFH12640.1 hypothetical protein HMPREF0731_1133 [Pseudoroseomonas cervicalis ATCC 49957]
MAQRGGMVRGGTRRRRHWLAGCLAGLLLVAGCASAPPPPSAESLGALSPWRARMAQAALAEWRAWGQITLEGWPETLPREPDPRLFDRIIAYWAAVPGEGEPVIRRHTQTHAALMAGLADSTLPGEPPPGLPSISLWAWPAWSAAFISYVMGQAGVPSYVFPPSASHAFYIDALLWQAQGDPARAAFLPRDPAEYAPRPGDLICADRANLPMLHWQERLSESGQFRPMHCDIVVAGGGGLVQAIGGNVRDAAVLRRFPADAQGRALPPPPDKPPFVLILENRMDLAVGS